MLTKYKAIQKLNSSQDTFFFYVIQPIPFKNYFPIIYSSPGAQINTVGFHSYPHPHVLPSFPDRVPQTVLWVASDSGS